MTFCFPPVPVSCPVLTLRNARTQVVVGDVLELRCEAQRGSPPILYWFYHNNVTLETSTSHSGQGVSLNLLLTADHSGTYSCKADNGLGPQHSEAVPLSVMGKFSMPRPHGKEDKKCSPRMLCVLSQYLTRVVPLKNRYTKLEAFQVVIFRSVSESM